MAKDNKKVISDKDLSTHGMKNKRLWDVVLITNSFGVEGDLKCRPILLWYTSKRKSELLKKSCFYKGISESSDLKGFT